MNKDTLESIIKEVNKLRDDLLFHWMAFDEKKAWMLVLTFINEICKYEIARQEATQKMCS